MVFPLLSGTTGHALYAPLTAYTRRIKPIRHAIAGFSEENRETYHPAWHPQASFPYPRHDLNLSKQEESHSHP
jgi:hypothetical protein